MNAVLLARIQFAVTVGYHFIFPSLTIGLAWVVTLLEWFGLVRKDVIYQAAGKFFGKILGALFTVGVVTGMVMEFQFGMNWATYSKFVGDIFGSPLAAEGITAFFLESVFMGVYLFGRERVSKGFHWFSSLMVAVGATLSAFWIIAANSWQQTPAGYVVEGGKAVIVNLKEAVFNPSTLIRYFHTVDASIIGGAFLVAGIAATLLLRKWSNARVYLVGARALAVSLVVALIASLVALYPTGHLHARQVYKTQPEKFATIEGVLETQTNAPATVFGVVCKDNSITCRIAIPKLLSIMVGDYSNTEVHGRNSFPKENLPPFALTFYTFHLMVILGAIFILTSLWGVLNLRSLISRPIYLRYLTIAWLLPIIANQVGWMTAEVGRQPWIVYGLLKTKEAVSTNVMPLDILISLILWILIYIVLTVVVIRVVRSLIGQGPDLGGKPAGQQLASKKSAKRGRK